MPDVDRHVLDSHCSTPRGHLYPEGAFCAREALGPLARWWLARWALEIAHGDDEKAEYPELTRPERPRFPDQPGSCWVVFRNKAPDNEKPDRWPMLGSGCVLPLCWKKGPHSPHLPRGLLDVADQAVESLAALGFTERWGLHLANLPWLEGVRLHRDLELGGPSAWAALAGGLVTLKEGLSPRGTVWATGAWKKGFGIDEIDGLSEKLTLAKEWKVRHFFVPESQAAFARGWVQDNAPDQIEIGVLRRTSEPDPMATLNDYLAQLTPPPAAPIEGSPDEEEQFRRCRNWYLHQDTKAARDYYRLRLLPALIRRCRREYEKLPLGRSFTHFVTVVSDHSELAIINPLMVRAKRCLLLYQGRDTKDLPDMEPKARECQRWLEAPPYRVECELKRFPRGPEMSFVLASHVARFTQGVPSDQIALDLTPGTKLMSYSLSQAAKAGNWLFFLGVNYLYERCPDGRPDPGSERPELLPVRY